jgi:hypothetical protein
LLKHKDLFGELLRRPHIKTHNESAVGPLLVRCDDNRKYDR